MSLELFLLSEETIRLVISECMMVTVVSEVIMLLLY